MEEIALKPYYREKNLRIGTISIPDGLVDITDPSYDKCDKYSIWGKQVKPGDYKCYVDVVNFPYNDENGKKHNSYAIMRVAIIHKKQPPYVYNVLNSKEWKEVGKVGVDAGLCGFYNHKPDLDEEKWTEFWQSLSKLKKFPLIDCDCSKLNGVTVNSGFGDGYYTVKQFENDGEIIGLDISFNS